MQVSVLFSWLSATPYFIVISFLILPAGKQQFCGPKGESKKEPGSFMLFWNITANCAVLWGKKPYWLSSVVEFQLQSAKWNTFFPLIPGSQETAIQVSLPLTLLLIWTQFGCAVNRYGFFPFFNVTQFATAHDFSFCGNCAFKCWIKGFNPHGQYCFLPGEYGCQRRTLHPGELAQNKSWESDCFLWLQKHS